jgi:polyhydroxyalkanoate synthesis regulator phasin
MATEDRMNERDFRQQVDRAVTEVQALCVPGLMPKEQAIEFLDDVISQLESAKEALNEEIENAVEDDGA